MSVSEAHATSPDKSSMSTSRKHPCLDPLSETLSNDLKKEEEPIASETLEMIEKLQKKVKLIQSQIRELRKVPSKEAIRSLMKKIDSRYQDVGNTSNSIEAEDIKAKRRHYLQERRSDKYKDTVFVYLDESCCNQNHVNNKVAFSQIEELMFCFHFVLGSPSSRASGTGLGATGLNDATGSLKAKWEL
ncbi:hypothetical protein BC939DRAFT_527026 [Gamsiella multidivaricata]|uniref:uncharacterized protein n=1 Tax=Gamsiella multidivaricata TaxID=101098 RepID=UPI00221FF83F|nr:uncharacterized protein BC939DRAFT_527026 [Gamsiella multidivaricata]KAI7828107.1 hypothetical protein BC939DRAFT_527026 [Gamsiella multidivaricata]